MEQQYLPDNLYREGVKYYNPTENGSEGAFKKFLEGLDRLYEREITRADYSGFCFGVKSSSRKNQ